MLDRYLNPTPTFHKWDKFWVGFVPALILPFIGLVVLYFITYANASYNLHEQLTVHRFLNSMQSTVTFMRIASLCCMLNGFLFFFFVNKDYNNASRAVILVTMLFVMAILIKELL